MQPNQQQVVIYQTAAGQCPFSDWFENLRDKRAQQRIAARIRRVESGNFGDFKAVGEGVSELRVDHGPGYRVYFGREGKSIVVLLVGGDKSTQSRDITVAKEYWIDYQSRKQEGGA